MFSRTAVIGVLFTINLLATRVVCLKILMIPINMNSHMQYFSRVGAALSAEGHQVTLLHPSNARLPQYAGESIELLSYQVKGKEPFANSDKMSRMMMNLALGDSKMESTNESFVQLTIDHWNEDCEHLFADAALMRQVNSTGYDVAVVDGGGLSCFYTYPYSLGLGYVTLSVMWYPSSYKVPALPSFVPNNLFGYTDHMTFTQRLANFVIEGLVQLQFSQMDHGNGSMYYYSERYAPHLPPKQYQDFLRGSLLWFSLEDITLSFPKPTMPNVIHVGDIMAAPAKPLPDPLRRHLEAAVDGAVLISFGSYLDLLPEGVSEKFCRALKALNMNVIWKSKTARCDSSRVLILPWVPQNDILGHPHLRAFISHGGYNSVIESISHSVPLVIFPISLDQPNNANIAASRRYGVQMSLKAFTSEELVENVRNVVDNRLIQEGVRQGALLLRKKIDTPQKRISFWLNHVVKHGDVHLRSASLELNAFQFLMVDIFLVIVAFVVFNVAFLVASFWCCFKCVRKCQRW